MVTVPATTKLGGTTIPKADMLGGVSIPATTQVYGTGLPFPIPQIPVEYKGAAMVAAVLGMIIVGTIVTKRLDRRGRLFD